MAVESIGNAKDQYLAGLEYSLHKDDNFQSVGSTVAQQLGSCERELTSAYAELETIKAPQYTDAKGNKLSPEEIKKLDNEYDLALRQQDAKVQKLNVRYKRLQNMMELFQSLVRSHYDMLHRIIQNIPVRN